jgi:C-terminal peptidase prc
MSGWTRLISVGLASIGAFASLGQSAEVPAPPRPVLSSGEQLRADAARAEYAGRWDKALDLYLRAYVQGRPSAELRERIRVCLRKAAQLRRQRDPAFQQFVLSLPVADALNLYGEAVGKLTTLYADRDRATPARLFALGLDEFDRALANPSFRRRHLDSANESRIPKFQRALRTEWRLRVPTNQREARRAVREVVLAAQRQLGVRNPSAIVCEFLCGACTGLDEYTVYVAPTGSQADLASPIVELAGYGILIRYAGSDVVVDGLVAGSWAALHTGLHKGDHIVRVNGRELVGGNPTTLAQALQAPGMLGHELEVVSASSGSALPHVRLPVPRPTVFPPQVLTPKDGMIPIGYLRIAEFRDSTPRELEAAVLELKARGARALVVDARGNPGGLLTAAIQVAQQFLPSGIVVTTQGQSPEFAGRVFSSDAGLAAFDLPLVLLIDAKTMSAAEAVAAAWKDHNRATLVGLPTFGKGVVQSPVRLTAADPPDGASRSGVLILTVASLFAPRGGPINGVGVTPHILEADPARQLELAVNKALELVLTGR